MKKKETVAQPEELQIVQPQPPLATLTSHVSSRRRRLPTNFIITAINAAITWLKELVTPLDSFQSLKKR